MSNDMSERNKKNRLTLQSIHLFPYGLIAIFPPLTPGPGFVYGEALALAVNSLFSPILRVDEDG